MSDENRWHMHRMGLVNFWLYDNEEFYFADGKLLLRGLNGSGKSITTQSFIPFILDGDRRPSRLDPFGSTDRRMEYYFLENTESDDVTGYLFLEFKRGSSNEYRTIGIGQRAVRGRNNMYFWGFVILDGRRIGHELTLVRDVGSTHIPLTKKELSNQLGTVNYFTESPGDYKEAVNKYLFGFPGTDLYDQYVSLLIKVRAPKLSKEFKPSKVYEILNDSLMTLGDDDLRPMVETMEKLDEMELRLENLRMMDRELHIIDTEYDRYNRFMLAKKAKSYISSSERTEADKKKTYNIRKEIEEITGSIRDLMEENENLEQSIREAEEKISVYGESDIKKLSEEKERVTEETVRLKGGLERIKKRLAERRAAIDEKKKHLSEEKNIVSLRQKEGERLKERLCEENRTLRYIRHDTIMSISDEMDISYEKRESARALSQYESQIDNCRQKVRELQKKTDEYNEKKDNCERLQSELERIRSELSKREDDIQIGIDDFVETLYKKENENHELIIDRRLIDEIKPIVLDFDSSSARDSYRSIIDRESRYHLDKISAETGALNEKIKNVTVDIERIGQELSELLSMSEPEPPRQDRVMTARDKLSQAGICFLPFYEAVDPAVEGEDLTMLEQQLMEMGILDSLLIAAEDEARARELLADESDVIFRERAFVDENISGLVCCSDVAGEMGLINVVEKALASVGTMAGTGECVACPDGYFRNGVIEGYINPGPGDQMRYLGMAARQKLKELLISEKEAELAVAKADRQELTDRLGEARAKKAALIKEKAAMPSIEGIYRSYDRWERTMEELDTKSRECESADEILRKKEEEVKSAKYDLAEASKDLPYEPTTEAYDVAYNSAKTYRDIADELYGIYGEMLMSKDRCASLSVDISENENILLDTEDDYRQKRIEYRTKETRLEEIVTILDSPENRRAAEEIDTVITKKDIDEKKLQKNRTDIAVKGKDIDNKKEKLTELEQELAKEVDKAEKLRGYFEEELKLELLDGIDTSKGLAAAARQAEGLLDKRDEQMTEADRKAALVDVFYRHKQGLSEQRPNAEDVFDRSEVEGALRNRTVIYAHIESRKVPIRDLIDYVRDSIAGSEELIKKKDRELFEKTLSNTLSRKLINRIDESRKWVKEMSNLMQRLDTSMGLSFALKWTPNEAGGDGLLSTNDLEKLLGRDHALLTAEDLDRISAHFRKSIDTAKQQAGDESRTINYQKLVGDVLDYRQWFSFRLMYSKPGIDTRELTDRAFNRLSGGEKAMAMYVPLFAAVNAQDKKASHEDHPRIVALDEAFAGVDEKNISSMFALVEELGFDYIMNSQALWGCYDTVGNLRISELHRPEGSSVVTVINYHWNGHKKVLEGHDEYRHS